MAEYKTMTRTAKTPKIIKGGILGSLVPKNLGAVTVGKYIITNQRVPNKYLIAHHLIHVFQWKEQGILFPFLWLWAYFLTFCKYKSFHKAYRWNKYEVEAFYAQSETHYQMLAEDVMKGKVEADEIRMTINYKEVK